MLREDLSYSKKRSSKDKESQIYSEGVSLNKQRRGGTWDVAPLSFLRFILSNSVEALLLSRPGGKPGLYFYLNNRTMYVRFYNKEGGKVQIWDGRGGYVTFADKKEALKRANEIDVAYHTTNKGELPKGISLDKANSRFRFHIWTSNTKMRHILTSKSLIEVVEAREYMLKSILDLL